MFKSSMVANKCNVYIAVIVMMTMIYYHLDLIIMLGIIYYNTKLAREQCKNRRMKKTNRKVFADTTTRISV